MGGEGGEGPGNEARWEITYPNMEPKDVEIAIKKRLLSVDLNTTSKWLHTVLATLLYEGTVSYAVYCF